MKKQALFFALSALLPLPAGRAPAASLAAAQTQTFYVAPAGRDDAPGTPAKPFATLARAQNAVRTLRRGSKIAGPVTVLLRGGTYFLREPLVFSPEDSGTAEAPIVYAAAPGETPVVSGGTHIAGWKKSQNGLWTATVPGVANGTHPYFRQLWVNGQRRYRARTPNKGFLQVAERPGADPKATHQGLSEDQFRFAPGDLKSAWTNPADSEVVLLHFWVDTHLPIASINDATRLVTFAKQSRLRFTDDYSQKGARYYVENVREALDEPGEWYLDRKTGVLSYLPRPGEDMTRAEVIAPRLSELVRFDGAPESGRYVEHVALRGISFSHNEWTPPAGETRVPQQQAANFVPGALRATGARFVAIENCRVAHFGSYGVQLGEGCANVRIAGCEFVDGAAGGVKINGGTANSPLWQRTGENVVEDCHLHDLGRVHHAAVGVLLMHTNGNTVAHNHIHHLFYSGVSVGWVWQYRPSVSRDNTVAFNHIHHIGQGLLSDLAGVYTLGISPGTVINNNLVHDVVSHGYGGWGLYTDQASTGVVLENNVVYATKTESFHQHWGQGNVLRNNVFFGGPAGALRLSKTDPERGQFVCERNVFVVPAGAPVYRGSYGHNIKRPDPAFATDRNLLWDGQNGAFSGGVAANPSESKRVGDDNKPLPLADWRTRGQDKNSLVADPGFVNPAAGDFSLRPGSPALKIGFRPIDLSRVGVRSAAPGKGRETAAKKP